MSPRGRWSERSRGFGLLALLVLLGVLYAPLVAGAATVPVSGRISVDTTWTAGNTYELADKVQIANSARVFVEPGTRIEGRGNLLEVFGRFEVAGQPSNRVTVRNLHLRGLGISALPSLFETFTVEIASADIDGGSLQGGGGSMYGSWTLTDSIVSNTSDPLFLWFPEAECLVARNVFINAAKISAGLSEFDVRIEDNVFYRSQPPVSPDGAAIDNWAAYGAGSVRVHGNTFMNPGFLTIAVPEFSGVPKMTATSNYWGTTTTSTVESMIFDREDDLSSPGTVPYVPFLRTAPPNPAVLPLATSLALSFSPSPPAYLTPVTIQGTLLDSRSAPLVGVPVVMETSLNGSTWGSPRVLRTDSRGVVQAIVKLPAAQWFRFSYAGVAGIVGPAGSAPTSIKPRAYLTTPVLSTARPVRMRTVTIYGYLKPRHPRGQRSVKLYFYRYERFKGKWTWRLKRSTSAVNADYRGYTKFSLKTSFPSPGRWRVRAYHSDSGHAATTTSYRYVTVR